VIMGLGPLGVFISVPAAEAVVAGIYWYYFRKGKWKEVKV